MVTGAVAGPFDICASTATATRSCALDADTPCALGAGARQPMPSSAIVSENIRV